MRSAAIIKYYFKDVLGKSMAYMMAIYVAIVMVIPLVVSALSNDPDVVGSSDAFFNSLIYMAIWAGIYAHQYTRMHIALGTTRKALWLNQTVLGSMILTVLTIAVAMVVQYIAMFLGNIIAGALGLKMTFEDSMITQWVFENGFHYGRALMIFAAPFALLSLVQCITYYFLRWKNAMLMVSLVLAVTLGWLAMSRTREFAEAIVWLFQGSFAALGGKLLLVGAAALGLSYIPLSRLPLKN